jgi:hypothetical protein
MSAARPAADYSSAGKKSIRPPPYPAWPTFRRLVYLPRTTRLATATLTALAGADLLQYAHALLEKAAS